MEGNIKSFLYLDEYKLASLSSQLFKGMTEYILKNEIDTHTESKSQKGNLLKGNLMGDALVEGNSMSEKRFLHDFAFNMFEQELIENGKLHVITSEDTLVSLVNTGIVKIKGKAIFDDYQAIIDVLGNFNSIGEAISFCALDANGVDLSTFLATNTSSNDRNRNAKVKSSQKALQTRWHQYLEDTGLRLDERKIETLQTLLRFSFREQLAVRIIEGSSGLIALSNLNRSYLRDPMEILIPRYSRKTEKELTLIGIITQCGQQKATSCKASEKDSEKMKYSLQNTISQFADMEETFTGRLANELVIEPIAIYHEI